MDEQHQDILLQNAGEDEKSGIFGLGLRTLAKKVVRGRVLRYPSTE